MAKVTEWEKVEAQIERELEEEKLDAEDSYLEWEQIDNGKAK